MAINFAPAALPDPGYGKKAVVPEEVQRQQALAQALQKQASDTSQPIYNNRLGFAKLLAGGLGGLAEGYGERKEAAAQQQNRDLQANMAEALAGKTPTQYPTPDSSSPLAAMLSKFTGGGSPAAPDQSAPAATGMFMPGQENIPIQAPQMAPQAAPVADATPAAPMQNNGPAPVAADVGDPSQPRGIRNANPGNIEDGPFARGLPGYQGSDGRFAKFDTPENGIGAMSRLIDGYGKNHGLNTVAGIIGRWAPANDGNNVSAYAANVAGGLGVDPNAPLDMSNPAVKQKLIAGMIQHENGKMPYSPSQFGGAQQIASLGGGPTPDSTPTPQQAPQAGGFNPLDPRQLGQRTDMVNPVPQQVAQGQANPHANAPPFPAQPGANRDAAFKTGIQLLRDQRTPDHVRDFVMKEMMPEIDQHIAPDGSTWVRDKKDPRSTWQQLPGAPLPIEKFTDVPGSTGLPGAQRSTTSGKINADPRATPDVSNYEAYVADERGAGRTPKSFENFHAASKATVPASITEYNFYKSQLPQGQQAMPYDVWSTAKARAGATNFVNNVDLNSSMSYDKQLAEGLGKSHAALSNNVEASQARARDIAAMQGAVDTIQKNGGRTGGLGQAQILDLQKTINSGANTLGITTPFSEGDISDKEFLQKFNRQIAGEQAKGAVGSRVTNFEMSNYLKANPGLDMSLTGNQRLLGIQAQIEQRNIAVGNAIREATASSISQGGRIDPVTVQKLITKYDEEHHIQDPVNGQDLTQSYVLPEFQRDGKGNSLGTNQPLSDRHNSNIGKIRRYDPATGELK